MVIRQVIRDGVMLGGSIFNHSCRYSISFGGIQRMAWQL